MLTEFKFTKDDFENSEIYDRKKTDYIGNYLVDFFENKKPVLKNHIHLVECFDHGMEEFTMSDDIKGGMHGFCFEHTFGGWENTLALLWNAKFNCGKEFPIGFYFTFRNKDLVKITEELSKLTDLNLARGHKFDEKNMLDIITGCRYNNLNLN